VEIIVGSVYLRFNTNLDKIKQITFFTIKRYRSTAKYGKS